MTPADLIARFEAEYGRRPRLFSAPGRVNLIGEHTDYNDGFVLPMGIEARTWAAAAPRVDRRIRARSLDRPDAAELDLDAPGPKRRGRWFDYVEGTAQALRQRGVALGGADLLVYSDVPIGAGLSSSAALEMSSGLALCRVSGLDPDRIELARAGQAAEHDYVGTLCGIMDQFITAMAEAGHGLLIDCRSLETRAVALPFAGAVLLVMNSGVHHELASSAYNDRRRECAEAAALLGKPSLRDVTVADLEAAARDLPDPLLRRARHVVTENARTLAAADAFARGDLTAAGRLMFESHRSLRDDYAVSCEELDVLVDAARAAGGVYGARMTGGGFGGSAIAVVRAGAAGDVQRHVEETYRARFGRAPSCFRTAPSEGAREDRI